MEKIYPSWRYHAEKPACIVKNAEEDAALGKGWRESPAEVVEECKVECPKVEVKKSIKRGASKP